MVKSMHHLLTTFMICLLGISMSMASEVTLELQLPNPLVPNYRIPDGELRVIGEASSRLVDITMPTIEGLELNLESNRSSYRSSTGTKPIRTFGVSVKALKAGSFTVPAVVATFADGSTLRSQPIQVTASEPLKWLRGNAQARVVFQPEKIIPGEVSKMLERVYLRYEENYDLPSNWGVTLPEGVIEMGRTKQSLGFVLDGDGNPWRVISRERSITMATPGTYEIAGQTAYGNRTLRGIIRQGAAAFKPATLTVDTLPNVIAPNDYVGLVGAIKIEAELERPRLTAGEGCALEVIISGRQSSLVRNLVIPEVPGLRIYQDDQRQAEQQANPEEKRFYFQVVPAQAGTYVIPPFSVPWLDPAARDYRRSLTQPLELLVLPGRERSLNVGGTIPAAASSGAVALPPPLRVGGSAPLAIIFAWWGLGIGIVAGLAIAFFSNRETKQRSVHRGRLLAKAINGGDLQEISTALYRFTDTDFTPEQNEHYHRALTIIEQARFGSGSIPDNFAEICSPITRHA